VLKAMNTLGVACQKLGQLAEAIELLDQTVALARTKLGPNHPTTLVYISNLAETYRAAGRLDEAIALHQQTLELLTAQLGPDHPETAGSMASLALSYLDLGRHAEAEKYARECLRIRQETMPDDWRTYNTMTLLGRSLAGQKALADAEPLLLEGYEGMLARAASIPPAGRIRITETLDAIIQLYEDWEKSEEAERWRATRDRLRDREKAAHHRLDAGGSND
jgi:tetratricopeptide (TPR) repeat protein